LRPPPTLKGRSPRRRGPNVGFEDLDPEGNAIRARDDKDGTQHTLGSAATITTTPALAKDITALIHESNSRILR
jgi:hypothetical protein